MRAYAFDVDETLETSNGPVTVQMLRDLHEDGHIVGICGNLSAFLPRCPDWHRFVSFTTNFDLGAFGGAICTVALNYGLIPKAVWLMSFQRHAFPGAKEYVMVGNVFGEKNSLGFVCGSHDSEAAQQAGWRFIREDDFAKGVR